MNIPVFPDKRPVLLSDKDLFASIFDKYPPLISEFTFTNIFAWRRVYQFCVSSLGGCVLVLSEKNKDILDIFEPICSFERKKDLITNIFSMTLANARFVRISEETARLFSGDARVKVMEDRDNFDYVYLMRSLTDLKGKDFDGKRNFLRRFNEKYIYKYNSINSSNLGQCLSFEKDWCSAKDCQHKEGLAAERLAVGEILSNMWELGVSGGMIEINGKVEAVALGEELNPDTFVVHVEKANSNYDGIYQAINNLFISSEAKAYIYVNREQDLGVVGLRQAKESYHPHHLVKKYTLSLN